MTEARINRADRKTQRVRAVTDPDDSPAIEAVKAALDVRPGWWRRHRTRLGAIVAIAGGVYTAGRLVAAADAETVEQAELKTDMKAVMVDVATIKGQLSIIIARLPKEPPQ